MNADQTQKLKALSQKFDDLRKELSTQINTYGFSEEFKKKQKEKLQQIQARVFSKRPPRLLIIGRRGSGKSSLINAMIGKYECPTSDVKAGTSELKWFSYKSKTREIEVLDTRGFHDTSKSGVDSEKLILEEIKKKCPDIVLFLCKAKEVHAGIAEDLDSAEKILKQIQSSHNCCISLIGVVTQCDELTPPDVKLPTQDSKKIKNIEQATSDLKGHLSSLNKANTALKDSFERGSKEVVPTVTYVEYDQENHKIIKDFRWNIEKLLEIIDNLNLVPDEASDERRPKIIDELAHLIEANKVLRSYPSRTGLVAGTVSCARIPGVSLAAVVAIQVNMVIAIAKIGGDEITFIDAANFLLSHKGLPTIANDVQGDVTESIVSIIAEYVSEQGVILGMDETLLKSLPLIGQIINGFLSADATQKLGEAAISNYILNEGTPPETQPSRNPAWA